MVDTSRVPRSVFAAGRQGLTTPLAWVRERRLSRDFWIFFTAAFFFDFGFAVYFFLFNLYLLDLGFSDRLIGLVGGAFTLGTVAGTLPAGLLARRFGIRPLLLVCFTAAPALGMLRLVAVREPAQIAFAFLAGLAMCLWGVCFLPAVARLTTEHNRASAFSLIFSTSIGTSALGGVLCGYLPQWLGHAGFILQPAVAKRSILLFSCGIAALGIAAILRLSLPPPEAPAAGEATAQTRSWRRPPHIPPFLFRFLPAMALWTAVLASFTPFANVLFTRDLHVPLTHLGLVFSLAQLVQFGAGLVTPVLFRKVGLVRGIVATQVLTAIAIAALAATQSAGVAIALYIGFSATQWMSSPGIYNLLMSRVPDADRSVAASMTLFSNAVLQSAAIAAAGILFTRFGYPRVLFGIAALALVAAVLFRVLVGGVSGKYRGLSRFERPISPSNSMPHENS